MGIQLVPVGDAPTSIACDALVIAAASRSEGVASLLAPGTEIDTALEGRLMEYLRATNFKAKVGDIAVVPTLGRLPAQAVVVTGLGPEDKIDAGILRRAAGVASRRLAELSTLATTLHLAGPGSDALVATVEGLLLGCYRFTDYKTDPHPAKIERVLLLGSPDGAAIDRGHALAHGTILARDLTNEPASTLTPDALAQKAKDISDVAGLECTIFDEDELRQRGFGGLLGVAQGSVQPPRLIQMRYRPENPRGTVVLVGKGITFDSGGLSLKDAKNMEQMKTDMAGAAAVMGAMATLSKLDVQVEVLGLVATTENMPGGSAIKPGDVITHYGGQTSEVNNTDAEGRLVLADAVAFASEATPDAIVDVATLTGAIMIALGAKATGLFANDDDLAGEIERAARAAGERFWRMPLYEDYRKDLDSEIADIKNSGTRFGGAIIGALYIKDFVGKGIPWAHLDIAGPARAESDYDEVARGGSGVAARTLATWVESRGDDNGD